MSAFDDLIPSNSSNAFGDLVPKKKKERGVLDVASDFGSAIVEGAKSTGRSLSATIDTALNDLAGVEQTAESQKAAQQDRPEALRSFQSDLQQRSAGIDQTKGTFSQILDSIGEIGRAVGANPEGAGQFAVEQLPNAGVALGSGLAGAKAGAAIGAAIPLPGAAVAGGIVGGLAGMFLGNAGLEVGGKAIEKAEGGFTPQERTDALKEGAVKGGVITAVDAATLGAGRLAARGLNRVAIDAGARAESKVLQQAGVDITDLASIERALAEPAIKKAAQEAGQKAAQAATTITSRVGTAGGLLATETAGEGVGEYLGELAATGEANVFDAVVESLAGLGQSSVETAFNLAGTEGNDLNARGIRRAGPDATLTNEGTIPAPTTPNQPQTVENASPEATQAPVTSPPTMQAGDELRLIELELAATQRDLTPEENTEYADLSARFDAEQETAQQTPQPAQQPAPEAAPVAAAPQAAPQSAQAPVDTAQPVQAPAPVGAATTTQLDPVSVGVTAAKIKRRELPEYANPRIDTTLAQEIYLQDIARKSPQEALEIAAQMRANPQAVADAANVPVDIVGRYAKIIERQLQIQPAPQAPSAAPAQQAQPLPPGMDGNLQNRDRSRQASVIQMAEIAKNPDYIRLGPSRTPDFGAPMVFAVGDDFMNIPQENMGAQDVAVMSDGQRVPFRYAVVEADRVQPSNYVDGRVNPEFMAEVSGTIKALNNGRTAGIRGAYDQGTAGNYQAELLADAPRLGIAPEVVQQTKNPMLVRVYSERDNTAGMAAKSQGQGLGMSPGELARQDAPLLDTQVLSDYRPGDVASAENRDFVRGFIGRLQGAGQDVASLITGDGQLSPQGKLRIEAALMQSAYSDSDLVQDLFDSLDTDIRAIGEAMKSVAGQWANMRDSARLGLIPAEADTTGNLIQAVNLVRKARRERVSLYDLSRQVDLTTGDMVDPITLGYLQMFYPSEYMTRAAGRDRVADALRDYANMASNLSTGADLFGETVTPNQIIDSIIQTEAPPNVRPADTEPTAGQAEPSGGVSGGNVANAPSSQVQPTVDEAQGAGPAERGQGEPQPGQQSSSQGDQASGVADSQDNGLSPIEKKANQAINKTIDSLYGQDARGLLSKIAVENDPRFFDAELTKKAPKSNDFDDGFYSLLQKKADQTNQTYSLFKVTPPGKKAQYKVLSTPFHVVSNGGPEALEYLTDSNVAGIEFLYGARGFDAADVGLDAYRTVKGLDDSLMKGEISVVEYLEQNGLPEDAIDILVLNNMRDKADAQARSELPYFAFIDKIRAALSVQRDAADKKPASTPQQRKAKLEQQARIQFDTDTLAGIERNYLHPFNNTLMSKLSPGIRTRFESQAKNLESGNAVKTAFRDLSEKYRAEMVIREVSRLLADRPAEFNLSQQTPEELAALDAQRQEREAQARESERRAQADAQVDDFRLTGSDRAIDQAEAAGQRNMFDDLIPQDDGGDWLAQMFADDGSAQAAAQAQPEFVSAGTKAMREAVDSTLAQVNADLAKWQAKKYKSNSKKVTFEGDGPTKGESLSIGTINERKKASAIENLTAQRNTLTRLQKVLGDPAGADDFMQEVQAAKQKATQAFENIPGRYESERAAFEAILLGDVLDMRPAGKGSITSNLVSKAIADEVYSGRDDIRFSRAPAVESQAFKKWFGDSKVVDADGKPLVMYHGTTSDISVFDSSKTKAAGVIFTTPNPDSASVYAQSRRDGVAPNVMPLYVSIKRPAYIKASEYSFSALETAATRGDIDGILVVDDSGEIVIAAPFEPTQIKSATGNVGTFDPQNPDIRFKRADEETRNLIAAHNTTAENLMASVKLGGLPVPSIGVTKADSAYTDFGDITLIGSVDLADPNNDNAVFAGDAYTKRFPSEAFVLAPRAEIKKLIDELSLIGNNLITPGQVSPTYYIQDQPNGNKLRNELSDNLGVMAEFLKRNGVEPIVVYRDPAGDNADKIVGLEEFIPRAADRQELARSPEFLAAVLEQTIVSYMDRGMSRAQAESLAGPVDGEKNFNIANKRAFTLQQVLEAKRDGKKVDYYRSRDAMRAQIEAAGQAKFDGFVESFVSRAFPDKYIQNTKGKPIPLTLQNVVEEMAGTQRGKEKTLTFGPGQAKAAVIKQFKSLAELQGKRDRVVSPEQYEQAAKKTSELMESYREKVHAFYRYPNEFGALDDSMRALAKLAKGKVTEANARAALVSFDFRNVPESAVQTMMDAAQALKDAPAKYFESKPQRAVDLSEFRGAVVPSNTPAEVRAELQKAGVEIVDYTPGDNAERQKAVARLSEKIDQEQGGVLFYRADQKPRKMAMSAIERASSNIVSKWANAPEVVVVSSLQDPKVPQVVRDMDAEQRANGATGTIPAFYHKAKVYLVADGINGPREMVKALYHEALGHYGLRSVFGSQLDPLLMQLVQARPDLIKAKAKEYGIDLSTKNGKLEAAEEVLARMSETDPQIGFVRRAVAIIRKWIRENLPLAKNLKMTDDEIITTFLIPARDWVRNGGRTGKPAPKTTVYNPAARMMFVGQGAADADMYSLVSAEESLKAGANAESVRKSTGWFKGADGLWRYEIADDEATWNESELKTPEQIESEYGDSIKVGPDPAAPSFFKATIGEGTGSYLGAFGRTADDARENLLKALLKRENAGKFNPAKAADGDQFLLGSVLQHPKLFAAYPELAGYRVTFVKDQNFRGAFIPNQRQILISASGNTAQMMSTLLHEIQHAIQHIEGFAQGGNVDSDFVEGVRKALQNFTNEVKNKIELWKWSNQGKIDAAEKAAQVARYGLMYESAQRLFDYSEREAPSGVFRLIRNEMQWIYSSDMRDKETANQLQRDFYAIPKRGDKRNRFLSDMAFRAGRMLMDEIPADLVQQFKNDPRTMKGMLNALQREASKKRKELKPLRDLERTQRDAENMVNAHRYSGSFQIYQALAGEVESRNTQTREMMTDEQRRNISPMATADVPAENIIVMFGGMDIRAPIAMQTDRAAKPQTETPEFKRWFGDSKVVDSEGKPLVVYHGTNADFSIFDSNFQGSSGQGSGEPGFFFEASAGNAARYTRGVNNGNLMPVYLSLKNPLIVDQTESKYGYDGSYDRVAFSNFIDDALELGNDGLIFRDVLDRGKRSTQYVVFDPTQIKSAIGNIGTFDASNPDIRFARTNLNGTVPPTPGPKQQSKYSAAKAKLNELLSPENIDAVIYSMQDRFIDLKRMRDYIKQIGGTVSDLNDAYLGEELYHKRLGKRVENYMDKELKPLLAKLRTKGVSVVEFEQYLHARHAPEANKVLAERNPNQAMVNQARKDAADEVKNLQLQLQRAKAQGSSTKALEDALAEAQQKVKILNTAQAFKGTEDERNSLSGMSDQDAAKYMASLSPAKLAAMKDLAADVDAMNEKTLQTLEQYGLETKQTLDAWRAEYKFYVPLYRDEAHPDTGSHPVGQGFSTKGSAAKARTGSNQQVTNILAHIAMQREAALTRGEKNRVAKQVYLLAAQNPDDQVWSVDTPPKVRTVDPNTGFVRTGIDPSYRNKPNVLMVRIAGKDRAIVFNEQNPQALRAVGALKNLDMSDMGFLVGMVQKGTRWFASINTQYNPVFGLINFARDAQSALLNLSTTALAGKQAQVAKNIPGAMRAIYRDTRGKPSANKGNAEWMRLWNEMQLEGGATGYRELFANAEDRAKALTKEIDAMDRGAIKKAAYAVVDWLSDYNEVMENAVRVAAYKAALDNGMSKPRAASLAKNLTVNFNRKGAKAQSIGAWYAFFNAAVQGTARMAETLSGPAGRKIMLGGVGIGMASSLLAMAVMGGLGGDEDEDNYSKIPDFVRERSIVVPMSASKYIAIPMPLGFHVIPNMGRIAAEMAFGKGDKSAGKHIADLFVLLSEAFNPVGGSGTLMQMLAPTVADPFAALAENKDWTGSPIYRADMNSLDPTPGFTRTKDTASALSKSLAEAINKVTGGTEYMPGAWSPTPDQIDYVIGQLTGGVGRELLKVSQTVQAPLTGEELPANKIPIVGRLYGTTEGASGQGGKFYENLREINILENEVKGRAKNGGNVSEFLQENPMAELYPAANAYEKQVRALRNSKRETIDRALPGYKDEVKAIDAQITDAMRQLNQMVEKRRAQE